MLSVTIVKEARCRRVVVDSDGCLYEAPSGAGSTHPASSIDRLSPPSPLDGFRPDAAMHRALFLSAPGPPVHGLRTAAGCDRRTTRSATATLRPRIVPTRSTVPPVQRLSPRRLRARIPRGRRWRCSTTVSGRIEVARPHRLDHSWHVAVTDRCRCCRAAQRRRTVTSRAVGGSVGGPRGPSRPGVHPGRVDAVRARRSSTCARDGPWLPSSGAA